MGSNMEQLLGVIAWTLVTIGLVTLVWSICSACRAGAGWLERGRCSRESERRLRQVRRDLAAAADRHGLPLQQIGASGEISAQPSSDGAESTPSTAR